MSALQQSYYCGEGSSQLIYQTIGSYLDNISEQHPDTEALVVRHQNIRWTYKQFNEQVNRLATGLLAIGIEPGDRVGIWGPNSYEWVLTQFATAKIGAIMVCINPAYRLYELEYALNKVECRAIICAESFKSSRYLDMLNELAPELKLSKPGALQSKKLPHLEFVIRMGDEPSKGMFNFEQLCDMGGDNEQLLLQALKSQLKPDDSINIQFTSGTTGSPKGATLTHCNILNNASLSATGMQLKAGEKLCIPVPLYHCFGMVLGSLACVSQAATMVFPAASYDPLTTLQAVSDEQCIGLHGVPTMFVMMLDHPEFKQYDVSSLRTGIMAGSPCPMKLMKEVISDLHMENILIGYGQTEVSPLNHLTLPEDTIEKRTATVGRAVPYVEIKIIDDNGNVCAIGEPGEVCTRGYSVMQGYWNDEEKTMETIDSSGWLHSGDIGSMDEDGYVMITGRIKDMIIRGGENIYPREIEEFLYHHPKIAEVQVFGVPDEKLGEQVCAWIQIKEGETCTVDEVLAFCEGQITHFKIPRYIEFVEQYPMTVTGKMQKFVMRDEMAQRLANAS
ncbi:AMP-binding protein [Thalassotalea sp. HSM 43]|uniref:AMP-binding protein n=1 Tax=Thalassotalea sp. HSM 43 TaxID=2552945 RepID=UPI0010801361|nr:AMP-binding protein [Thalassotalea sp. HSM 43]QBY03291.1 AMP-binding protein [Thalassotalea sp. HSM 43]